MDKDILDKNNNPNNDSVENNEHKEDTVKEEHKTDDIYSNYPKEVVQILMNSNPLRNREQPQTLKANETKEELFSKTRVQRKLKKPQQKKVKFLCLKLMTISMI